MTLFQAGELEILSAIIKWGETQLVKRLEERGNPTQTTGFNYFGT